MTSFTNLNSENQDLKNKIALVILRLETEGIIDLEEQVTVLMVNMMNFFAKHVDDIPSFDSMTKEQQDIVVKKFKNVAQNLKSKKIKSIEEMLQTFVFTVLIALEERAESLEHSSSDEIINKKSKAAFNKALKQAAEQAIYKMNNNNDNLIRKKDFIHNAILFGVTEAMNIFKLNIKFEELNKDALQILNITHRKKETSLHLTK